MKKNSAFISLLMAVIMLCAGAHAELMTVSFDYQSDKGAAEEMLYLINDYRVSGDAWIFDQNENRIELGKLDALEIDPNLSEAALQRAIEQSLSFGHIRPDGTLCDTIIGYSAENTAWNATNSALLMYSGFMEQSESFAYQGHRRILLNNSYKRIGVGCAQVAGLTFWAILLSPQEAEEFTPQSTDNKAVVQMDTRVVRGIRNVISAKDELTMYVGENAPVPETKYLYELFSAHPLELEIPKENWKYSSANPFIVRVEEDGTLYAVESGETQLIISAPGSTITVKVTVNPSNCWENLNGTWYRYDDHGKFAKGWQKIDGKWYHFDSDGRMQTSWQKIDGRWYYLKLDGSMHTGWIRSGGSWYYLDSDGTMATGWRQLQGKWYWFDANGVMATGNRRIGQKTYQFDNNGAWIDDQPANQWKKNDGVWSYYNANHQRVTGWQMIDGQWYYFNAMGEMQTGWVLYGGHWYYLYGNGAMAVDTTLEIKGVTYSFDAHGVMQ